MFGTMMHNLLSLFMAGTPLNPSSNPFKEACNQGDLETIEAYINQSTIDSFSLSMDLLHAVAADQVEIVCFLLGRNIRILFATGVYVQSQV